MPLVKPVEYLREYLEVMNRATSEMKNREWTKYPSHESFVLAEGKEYMPTRYLPGYARRGEPKMCYANTVMLIQFARETLGIDLRYVEGYAAHAESVIPVLHAWAVDPRKPDEAIDVTWAGSGRKEHTYIGVEFEWDAVMAFWNLFDDGVGVIDSQYLLDFPIQRGLGFTLEIVREGWEKRRRAHRDRR